MHDDDSGTEVDTMGAAHRHQVPCLVPMGRVGSHQVGEDLHKVIYCRHHYQTTGTVAFLATLQLLDGSGTAPVFLTSRGHALEDELGAVGHRTASEEGQGDSSAEYMGGSSGESQRNRLAGRGEETHVVRTNYNVLE